MAKSVILLIILILILLIAAIFSTEIHIVLSFYASTEYLNSQTENPYKYSVVINRIIRRDESNRKKSKSRFKQNIINKIKKLSYCFEISDISIIGNISLANPFATSLSVGFLNIAAGFFTAFLSSHFSKISLSRITIQPVYSENIQGDIFFECIVKANAGNIITESVKHFINTQKKKKGRVKNVKSHK